MHKILSRLWLSWFFLVPTFAILDLDSKSLRINEKPGTSSQGTYLLWEPGFGNGALKSSLAQTVLKLIGHFRSEPVCRDPVQNWLATNSLTRWEMVIWVHQNRAILCGCGGDLYRSPTNRAIFWGPKMRDLVLAAEFPAIPSSAVKIASERRCAILVHSDGDIPTTHVGPANLQKCRGFLLHILWRSLPGILIEDFSWHFLPTKMRRTNPVAHPCKDPATQQQNLWKIVLPKSQPNK